MEFLMRKLPSLLQAFDKHPEILATYICFLSNNNFFFQLKSKISRLWYLVKVIQSLPIHKLTFKTNKNETF